MRDVTLAWQIIRLFGASWSGKLPSLTTLIQQVRGEGSRPQSLANQRVMLQMLSAQYGIPLRKRMTDGTDRRGDRTRTQ